MRKLYILGLIALAALIIGLAWADQITLTTYYPAPYGVYNDMVVMNSLGIGTTGPVDNLHVKGGNRVATFEGDDYNQVNIRYPGNDWGMLLTNSDGTSNGGYHYSTSGNNNSVAVVNVNNDALHLGTNNTARLTIDHNGNVGIGTLSSNGAVYSNGTYLTNTDPSSRDYKENIKPIDLQAERLLKLTPKSFTWKDNGKEDIGYIAEEVWEVLPELCRDDGTTKGYASAKLPFYTIELVKKQQGQIENLKSEIETLKAQLNIGQ